MHTHHAATRLFVWGGAVLFAAALGFFLFTYAVTFGEITPGNIVWSDVATDGALFSVFALHHSLFARERVRALMSRTLSPRVERSVYVWVASLMLIGVCLTWRPIAGLAWHLRAPWSWPLIALQLLAVWLTLRAASIIDIFDLAGVRQASIPNFQLPTPKTENASSNDWELGVGRWEFKTEGPYGVVRHPIYSAWVLLVFAVGTMTMTRMVFAVVSCVYIVIAIPFEERSLRRASQGSYDHYMKRVPSKLIPRVF